MAAKEFPYLILFSLILGYVIAFPLTLQDPWSKWIIASGLAFIILTINLLAKKWAAYKLDCNAEIEPWSWRRYWLYESAYWKKPIPMWLIWPIVAVWISIGRLKWLAISTFEITALPSRVQRRFSELTEIDIAAVAMAGIAANILVAVLCYAFGQTEFAILSMWFVFFNMLPLPTYDGGRIFFGEKLIYVFMFIFSIAMLILFHLKTSTIIITASSLMIAIIAAFVFYGLRER